MAENWKKVFPSALECASTRKLVIIHTTFVYLQINSLKQWDQIFIKFPIVLEKLTRREDKQTESG